MKNLFIPAMLLFIIAACSKPAPPPPPAAPPIDSVGENNKMVVQRFTDAVVKGDTAGIATFLTDNYKGYGPGLTDSTDRAKLVSEWSKNWKDTFASVDFKSAGKIAFTVPADGKYPGDWVADWAVITVNYKNGLKPVTFWWHSVYRVKDGKIEVSREFYNVNDFFTQHGYTITPPKAAKK